MPIVWNFPTRILFGEGSVADVGAEVERLEGRHALLVTDPGIIDAGIVDQVGKGLKRSKIAYTVYSGLSTNPTEKEALAAAEAFGGAAADIVVAVGGGAALDVAKLV